MARLPALIDALTLCDGRPRGSVDHMARALREAGLIQTTKRGRGAAEMTTLDAAALVLGLYGLGDASPDAMAQARVLSELKPSRPTRKGSDRGECDPLPPVLRPLARAPSLVDAVAALIELAPLLAPDDAGAPKLGVFSPSLELHRPRLSAAIALTWRGAEPGLQGVTFGFRPPDKAPRGRTYTVTTRVLGPILITLHGVLFPEAEPAPAPRAGRR